MTSFEYGPRPVGGASVSVDPDAPHPFGRGSGSVCSHCEEPPDIPVHTLFTARLLADAVAPEVRQRVLDILIEHFASCREYWASTEADLEAVKDTEGDSFKEVSATEATYGDVLTALGLMRDGED